MGNQNTNGLPALLQTSCNLLGNIAAAAYLGVTPRTLEVWRCTFRSTTSNGPAGPFALVCHSGRHGLKPKSRRWRDGAFTN